MFRRPRRRSTPKGEHRPVMLAEVLQVLQPKPGEHHLDCTLGFGGHSAEILRLLAPDGKLVAFDLDAGNLASTREKLDPLGTPYSLHHGNFAGISHVVAQESLEGFDGVLADLGMSSMQVDDTERGFSFMRDGPLDMRMDQSRGKTAADLLATLSEEDLTKYFTELGDEPQAAKIARAIVATRSPTPILRTRQLMELIQQAAPVRINPNPIKGEPSPRQQRIRPVARVFQALRIMVNRELANLQELLRAVPYCLKPGGRVAIISFHSGEDRMVKASFKEGLRTGLYSRISEDAVRPTFDERMNNPRSRSAKLRWAVRAE
jgi:16S rRNA (cytosine1402-N4)-methyltransferase